MASHDSVLLDRARGALLGLAIGDALGMPTQSFSRPQIAERYGRITAPIGASDDQPIAPGMDAGAVTDDTEQAVIVAELLIAGHGHVDAGAFAAALIAWEQDMIVRGSHDLLGPSTKAALTALQSGTSPEESGRYGTTNGAAMRVAPVGVASPLGPGLLESVVEVSRVTHNTGLGMSAAAAVAAAVSACLDRQDLDHALSAAVALAGEGERCGYWVAGASIPRRFLALRPAARRLGEDEFPQYLYDVVGTSVQSQESVVSALLIVDRYRDRPYDGLCCAASLGGDTDTIAAIAGAILGAAHGAAAFPHDVASLVESRNALATEDLAERLLALRAAAITGTTTTRTTTTRTTPSTQR
ncbi:ADP-ribosylglycohydrolase family protein [Raineyella sp. LH-20]|uniref:ADP-ribosylglycohydrolase family protein n=1 Tax=Raineyella sp. LH-20 TaxID=3081204 RepID=UPI0029534581|nr:ADP-ribosylglycohydrolase family protein [Raineyella sp. LH-20]WOP19393.1 ADP-ribosylglycohydrolase family protein [Raineyella sp. LH-20]